MMTVLLVDDNPLFRKLLEKILSPQGITIAAALHTGAQSLAYLRQAQRKTAKKPDIIVLNELLPDMSSEKLCQSFHRHWPQTPCLFLINAVHWPTLSRLLNSPAKGFLTKECLYWCPEAIQVICSGKTYLQPDLAWDLLHYRVQSLLPPLETLSTREYEVLLLLARAKPYEEIAERLHMSIKTIYNIKMRALRKLGLKTRKEWVKLFCLERQRTGESLSQDEKARESDE